MVLMEALNGGIGYTNKEMKERSSFSFPVREKGGAQGITQGG